MLLWTLVQLVAATGLAVSATSPRFLVSTPLMWHSGEEQRISVNVFNLDNVTIRVHLAEIGLNRPGLVKSKLLRERGYPVTIFFKVYRHYLPPNLWSHLNHNLHLLVNGTANGRIMFVDVVRIRFLPNPCTMVATTDRQVYHSADNISVFVVTSNRHRLLSNNWVNCFVKSTESSRDHLHSLQYLLPNRVGYAGERFAATKLNATGRFGLYCQCPSQDKHRLLHQFLVQGNSPQPSDDYGPVLFTVKVSSVSCLTKKTNNIVVKIRSKYFGGNAVVGSVKLNAVASHPGITISKSTVRKQLKNKGKASIPLTIKIINSLLADTSSRHSVTVTVRVKATQAQQTKTKTLTLRVASSQWTYSLTASPAHYKAGETVTVKACARDCQGRHPQHASFHVGMLATVNKAPAQTSHQWINLTAENNGGCAKYSTSAGTYQQIRFLLQNSNLSSSLKPVWRTARMISHGKFGIHLDSSKCTAVKVGKECPIDVFFEQPHFDGFLQYELTGANKLISSAAQRLTVSKDAQSKVQIRLLVTSHMFPKAKLTVIAYNNATPSKLAVADHIIQSEQAQSEDHEVLIWLDKSQLWPGQGSVMEVTGQPRASVLILAEPFLGQLSSWKNITTSQKCSCACSELALSKHVNRRGKRAGNRCSSPSESSMPPDNNFAQWDVPASEENWFPRLVTLDRSGRNSSIWFIFPMTFSSFQLKAILLHPSRPISSTVQVLHGRQPGIRNVQLSALVIDRVVKANALTRVYCSLKAKDVQVDLQAVLTVVTGLGAKIEPKQRTVRLLPHNVTHQFSIKYPTFGNTTTKCELHILGMLWKTKSQQVQVKPPCFPLSCQKPVTANCAHLSFSKKNCEKRCQRFEFLFTNPENKKVRMRPSPRSKSRVHIRLNFTRVVLGRGDHINIFTQNSEGTKWILRQSLTKDGIQSIEGRRFAIEVHTPLSEEERRRFEDAVLDNPLLQPPHMPCLSNAPGRSGFLLEMDQDSIIDGGWSTWSQWSTCSKICGPGQRARDRRCNNPTPRSGGRPCPGKAKVEQRCNVGQCRPADTSVSHGCGQLAGAEQHMIPNFWPGGENLPALQRSWPWVVLIYRKYDESFEPAYTGVALCCNSGSRIRYVLTAGHVVDSDDSDGQRPVSIVKLKVSLGRHALDKDTNNEQTCFVKRIVRHPNYRYQQFRNNIALLDLDCKLPPTPDIRCICLPTPEDEQRFLAKDSAVWLAGWGSALLRKRQLRQQVLRETKMNVTDSNKCARSTTRMTQQTMCLQRIKRGGGGDVCEGDDGAPLMAKKKNPNQYILLGIASWAESCFRSGRQAAATRIASYVPWIRGNTSC